MQVYLLYLFFFKSCIFVGWFKFSRTFCRRLSRRSVKQRPKWRLIFCGVSEWWVKDQSSPPGMSWSFYFFSSEIQSHLDMRQKHQDLKRPQGPNILWSTRSKTTWFWIPFHSIPSLGPLEVRNSFRHLQSGKPNPLRGRRRLGQGIAEG